MIGDGYWLVGHLDNLISDQTLQIDDQPMGVSINGGTIIVGWLAIIYGYTLMAGVLKNGDPSLPII